MIFTYVFPVLCLATLVSGFWNSTHICCDETVSAKESESYSCCGKTPFDSKTQTCCHEGLVVPADETLSSCCVKEDTEEYTPYDRSRSTCCDGVVTDKAEEDVNKYFGCCGSTPYDYNNELCCQNEVIDKKTASPEGNDFVWCCGNGVYNFQKELCCDGNAVPKEDNQNCCGGETYNYLTHICCNNEVILNNGDKGCCGTEVFDKHSRLCDFSFNEESKNWTFTLMVVENNHSQLCNKTLYDFEIQTCCYSQKQKSMFLIDKTESVSDARFASCCETSDGFESYDSSKKVCCESAGKLMEIPEDLEVGKYPQCCNGELYYNHSWQLCCGNELLTRPGEYQGYCCGQDMISDYNKQFCCDEVVHEQTEKAPKGCCGKEVFVYTETSCCFHGSSADLYDPKAEKCDYDKGLSKIEDGETESGTKLDPLCR